MPLSFFITGLIIGFSIAAPVGPSGLLCIRRTMMHGRLSGFITGLGAATVDAFYTALVIFGLSLVTAIIASNFFWFRLFAGTTLFLIGVKAFFMKSLGTEVKDQKKHPFADYFSSIFFNLTNPIAIISYVAVFAGLGLGILQKGPTAAELTILGVFCGSALWWFILSGGINFLHSRFHNLAFSTVNKISGIIIGGFGLFLIVK